MRLDLGPCCFGRDRCVGGFAGDAGILVRPPGVEIGVDTAVDVGGADVRTSGIGPGVVRRGAGANAEIAHRVVVALYNMEVAARLAFVRRRSVGQVAGRLSVGRVAGFGRRHHDIGFGVGGPGQCRGALVAGVGEVRVVGVAVPLGGRLDIVAGDVGVVGVARRNFVAVELVAAGALVDDELVLQRDVAVLIPFGATGPQVGVAGGVDRAIGGVVGALVLAAHGVVDVGSRAEISAGWRVGLLAGFPVARGIVEVAALLDHLVRRLVGEIGQTLLTAVVRCCGAACLVGDVACLPLGVVDPLPRGAGRIVRGAADIAGGRVGNALASGEQAAQPGSDAVDHAY